MHVHIEMFTHNFNGHSFQSQLVLLTDFSLLVVLPKWASCIPLFSSAWYVRDGFTFVTDFPL